ncbi:MAG: hypothetical protein WD824_26285 [Cyclobacteriaceae bacterium]
MKKAIILFGVFFASWTLCGAQGDRIAVPVNFEDSVRIVLENTRNIDATVIGAGFFSSWNQLGVDQQILIKKQSFLMRKRKFPLKSHMVNYFGAIVNAITIEKADATTLTGYLKVAGKVIEKANSAQVQNFFAVSRSFFQFHALSYDKTFRLYAREDSYSFDYLENTAPATLSWNEPVSSETETPTETADPPPTEFVESTPVDTMATQDFMPSWMTPAPPPSLEGPVIKFDKVTLNFVTTYDSVLLRNTRGSLSLIQNIFVGEEGSFDWTPAGLGPDSVVCNMTSYSFNVKKAELNAEVVKLNYKGKTPGAVPGKFEFKSQPRKDSTLSTYPRFKSFQSNLMITGLADENVRYKGGFSLIGNKISSISVTGEPAVIEVYNEGQKKFTAQSAEFNFLPGSITSNRTKVNIHQGNDSIVHQMVRLKYTYGSDSTQQLMLQKDKGDMRNAPYTSTFFNIDFSADLIRWDLYSDSLNMQIDGARNTVPLIIESIDFYDPEDYRLLKGVGFSFHPLALAANYALKNGVREFYSGDLAQASRKNPMEIKQGIEFLKQKGLVNYNSRTDLVQVKQKALDIFLAYKGEEDYDNLKIHSVIGHHPNATINFQKRNMTVRGVEEFDISDSLNVHIIPDSSVITILQNRDIQFDGTVSAGNFEITGKGFTLKYDSFFISLTHIDSINFFVTEKNARGQEIRRKVNNSMVGADSTAAAAGGLGGNSSSSSGTLFISRANNKSGKLEIPGYPRLDATTGGVIYFDREEVLGGVYDRSMFFVVPPFNLDSLNNADPVSINFEGTFISSGMFPSIKETLHTMPDKSLGFEHAIPQPGYQLYNGDGKMNGIITMNTRGLRGLGQIDFLAATVSSKEFIFYPDSVLARGSRARIKEKQFGPVLFPQASLPDFQMKWLPKEDKMQLKNLKAPFNFYDSTAQMHGVLTISKQGVAGAGKLETRGTELISREMNFGGKDFGARHARFKVKSDDPDKDLLAGNDIRLKFNLEENYADISPEIEGTAAIEFPYAQFKTSIPRARWDLATQKITMSKATDVPIENSYFYTTRKDLDSLHFNAEKAEYDLKTQELKVSGIPYIIVADARITPENNEVLIHENARIGTLNNTTIVLDTLNGYHRLTEGVVDIISRKEFTGYATYQYVNFLNDTFSIKMTDFRLEPISGQGGQGGQRRSNRRQSLASMQTVAKGSVTEKESLVLGAGMFYKGDLTMYATRPALQLDGFVKLDIRKIKNYDTWIEYSQSGDETEVVLGFDKATNEEGKRVTAGLHFSSADNSLYITFANEKKSEDDDDLFTPSGKLFYDTESKEYKIEDTEKAAGNKLSGKVFAYNDETSQVRFEGHVNVFSGSKNFNITATAIGSGNFETNEVRMNAFLMLDSDVPSTAFDAMARDIQQVIKNEGAEEGLGDQTELLYKIADIVGERAAKEYEAQSVQGYVSLATLPELAKPIVFSDVKLKWSPKFKAFYSDGRLGISNMGKIDINGRFEGFMEIRKTEDGIPVFHVFFKASPESWYYFGMEDNRLLIYSSNKDFNTVISKRSNAGKAKIGEVAFIPGSEEETLSFINRFRKQYLGIEVPYSLYEGAAPAEDRPTGENRPVTEENKPIIEDKKQETDPVVEPDKKVEPQKTEDGPKKDETDKKEEKEPEKKKEEDDGF